MHRLYPEDLFGETFVWLARDVLNLENQGLYCMQTMSETWPVLVGVQA